MRKGKREEDVIKRKKRKDVMREGRSRRWNWEMKIRDYHKKKKKRKM